MNIESYFLSDKGPFAKANQDYAVIDTMNNIFVVADGVGGSPAGDLASKSASESFINALKQEPLTDWLDESCLTDAVRIANETLLSLGRSDPFLTGLSTTLTALIIIGKEAKIVHIGDCRVHLFREQKLIRLTQDHNLAAGFSIGVESNNRRLQNMLFKYLGDEDSFVPDIVHQKLTPGDIYILSSDGLEKAISESILTNKLIEISTTSAQSICEAVMELINLSPSNDNVTVMTVKVF